MSQRRGPAKPPMRGRGPSRPPMQTGQPQQQQNYQQQPRQTGRGGGGQRGRGRGRGGARQYNSQRQNYNQSGQGGYGGGGGGSYQNNQQQNQNSGQVQQQQQAAPQQQSAPRRGPMKTKNNEMFAQFNAQQQSGGQSMMQQQAPQRQNVIPQQQQQQNIPQQTQEEEKAVIEQPQETSGGTSQDIQQQQAKVSGPTRKPKAVKTGGGARKNQPPWMIFTGEKKRKPDFADWGHRVRQVLSADTLRIARLKPRNANPLDPPEIIQLTLDGISVPRCQRYDPTKSDADRKAQAKREKKKSKEAARKQRKAQKEAAEAKSQEQAEKEDSKDEKPSDGKKGKGKGKGGGGAGDKQQQSGGKSNKKSKKDKDDAKDNKDGKDNKQQQKQNKQKRDQQQQQQQQQTQFGFIQEEDQPYAYEAREFVRKQVMNKNVFFAAWRVVSSPQTNTRLTPRYWGDVYYQDGKNNQYKSLTRELVANGYAELKPKQFSGDLSQKEQNDLQAKQDKARKANLNIHSYNKDTDMNEKRVLDRIRTIKWIQYDEQEKFGTKFRGKTLKGIIDQVISGSTLRVELVIDEKKNIHNNVVVNIAGVNAPKVFVPGQKRPNMSKMSNQQKRQIQENEQLSKRYGVIAREWTEERLLGQQVKVKILRVSNKQIIAQIIHEKGRIGPSLLKKGLAFYEGWSAVLTDKVEQQQLSQAVQIAQNNNQQIWNFIRKGSRGGPRNEQRLTVIQVISGDTIACEDMKGKEIRFTLSSVRAPKLGVRLPKGTLARQAAEEEKRQQQQQQQQQNNNRQNNNRQNNQQRQQQQQQPQSPAKSADGKKKTKRGGRKRTGGGGGSGPSSPAKRNQQWEYKPDEYLAREAKEFVRQRCIGKQVRIIYEYTRKAPTFRGQKEISKNFATVFYPVNDKGKEGNLALDLIKKGLVDLVVHGKQEINRSLYYADLEEAWNQARGKNIGLYEFLYIDNKKGGFIRPHEDKRKEKAKETAIGDYSGVDESQVKTHELIDLNQYLKNNKVRGIVEFVFGANRVKIYIPQRKVCIAVRLADVRVGDWGIEQGGNIDPFRKEARDYLNKTILQRDIELVITSTGQETGTGRGRGRGRGRGKAKSGLGGKGGTQASRNPNYDGHIYFNGTNISEELLERGLATIIRRRYNDTMYDRTKTPSTFKIKEEKAKKERRGLWENYDEDTGNYEAKDDEETKRKIANSMTGKEVEVVVSHIETASLFYVNDANSDAMQRMNEEMEKLKLSNPKPPKAIRPGKSVKYAAKYDGYYARARVKNRAKERPQQQQQQQQQGGDNKGGKNKNKNKNKNKKQNDESSSATSEWYVEFIDYGNTARIQRHNFAELPANLRPPEIPPLAMRCELAGINVYKKNERAFNDAGYFFSQYAFQSENQKLKMKILYDDQSQYGYKKKTWFVELFVGDKSINQLIAREGFVTLIKPKDLPYAFTQNKEHGQEWSDEHKLYVKQYLEAIKANISLAKDEHKNIWYHGDVESADEDNFPDQPTNKKGAKSRR